MTAKVNTSLATHAEFQERVTKSRPAVTKMLWQMVLREMNIVAANGGQGVRLVWRAASDNKLLELLSLDVDYPTLFIYQTWQYDTELFTRFVADAGFPHLCKDITAGQSAVTFISWNATEEKSKS
jgi:hypothetical protein